MPRPSKKQKRSKSEEVGRQTEDLDIEENDEECEIWQLYECSSIDYGIPHPGAMVEANNIRSVPLPPADYPLQQSLQRNIEDGSLSSMQLEGILYACERHARRLPDGKRAGFFLGDSAGSGKGRQIAGILMDNLLRGRTKHVWFSASTDLYVDAKRDFEDLGCFVSIYSSLKTVGISEEAVLFCTYSELTSEGSKKTLKSRYAELKLWLGGPAYEGVFVFDECHKAKQCSEHAPSKTAEYVIKLQEDYPNARVVYASATGISAIENMGYMTRMGLWGDGTVFPSFGSFLSTARGMGALELMALEFKGTGSRVARSIGYQGAEFLNETLNLSPAVIQTYRTFAELWHTVYAAMRDAEALTLKTPNGMDRQTRPVREAAKWNALFWSFHQRFFRQLITCVKVPAVVELAKKALSEGHCVVIGLQTTGEAALVDGKTYKTDKELVSVCKSILYTFVHDQFPVKQMWVREPQDPEEIPYVANPGDVIEALYSVCTETSKLDPLSFIPGILEFLPTPQSNVPYYNKAGEVIECLVKRDLLLDRIMSMAFPASALDDVLDQLGGATKVAEMTGRSHRQVRVAGTKQFRLESRHDSINLREQNEFMVGKKWIAIISEAASTGISLHADRTRPNQRRRVHITLELPWAADQAIQQLGRSHRTNQASAPKFYLLNSGLGGEHRFVSGLSRKLQALGALSQGDRRASTGALGESTFDSSYGREVVRTMFLGVQKDTNKKGWREARDALDLLDWETIIKDSHFEEEVGVDSTRWCSYVPHTEEDAWKVFEEVAAFTGEEKMDVARFFNRMLGLPKSYQSFMFNVFHTLLDATIKFAKKMGRYDRGVQTFQGQLVTRRGETEVLYRDYGTGGRLILNPLNRDRGVTLEAAMCELEYRLAVTRNANARREDFSFRGITLGHFYRAKDEMKGRRRTLMAIPVDSVTYKIVRPGTGIFSASQMKHDSLVRVYDKITNEAELVRGWAEEYEWSLTECTHGRGCSTNNCTVGKRRFQTNILTGNVLSLWTHLEVIIQSLGLTKAEEKLHIIQLNTSDTGEKLVGLIWPDVAVKPLKDRIRLLQDKRDREVRSVVVQNIPVNAPFRKPKESMMVNDLGRSEYYRLNHLFNEWMKQPLTEEVLMSLVGFAWKNGVVTQSSKPQIRVGYELLTFVNRSHWDIKSALAGATVYSFEFLRPWIETEQAERTRFWNEGLAKEVPTPVDEEAKKRLLRSKPLVPRVSKKAKEAEEEA
jgi:hypothetical protein